MNQKFSKSRLWRKTEKNGILKNMKVQFWKQDFICTPLLPLMLPYIPRSSLTTDVRHICSMGPVRRPFGHFEGLFLCGLLGHLYNRPLLSINPLHPSGPILWFLNFDVEGSCSVWYCICADCNKAVSWHFVLSILYISSLPHKFNFKTYLKSYLNIQINGLYMYLHK